MSTKAPKSTTTAPSASPREDAPDATRQRDAAGNTRDARAPQPPPPVFDAADAKPVKPYRHEPTARTVAFHQDAGDGRTHLFSVTRAWIATVSAEGLMPA